LFSGPGGSRDFWGSETYPTFISIKGYPESNPKVIVVRKARWVKDQLHRYLDIFEVREGY